MPADHLIVRYNQPDEVGVAEKGGSLEDQKSFVEVRERAVLKSITLTTVWVIHESASHAVK